MIDDQAWRGPPKPLGLGAWEMLRRQMADGSTGIKRALQTKLIYQ